VIPASVSTFTSTVYTSVFGAPPACGTASSSTIGVRISMGSIRVIFIVDSWLVLCGRLRSYVGLPAVSQNEDEALAWMQRCPAPAGPAIARSACPICRPGTLRARLFVVLRIYDRAAARVDGLGQNLGGGGAPARIVRGRLVRLVRILVPVDLVEEELVRVGVVLKHIEAQAAGFV